MNLQDRFVRRINPALAAIIILVLATGLLIGIRVASVRSVSYQAMVDKLPEMQERTHTRLMASTSRAVDLIELPIACRIRNSVSSIPVFSKNRPMRPGKWTETWEIQADGNTLSISLVVLRNQVCMAVLESAPNLDATSRWSATLRELFPGLPQKRVSM